MWSDQTPAEVLLTLVSRVRSILSAPSPAASLVRTRLAGGASVEQVAEVLRDDPGFAYLKSGWPSAGTSCPTLFRDPLATVTCWDGYAVLSGPGGTTRLEGKSFDILRAVLDAWQGPSGGLLTGFLSYDLGAEIEELERSPSALSFPKFHFALYDSALVLEDGGWWQVSTNAWRQPPDLPDHLIHKAERAVLEAPGDVPCGPLRSHLDRSAFESAVARTVAAIHAGDIYQTNLCRSLETTLEPGTEWDLFRRLRSISPARYEAFLRIDSQRSVFSISPEQFLKVQGNIVESSPIKGTRPRAHSVEEDTRLVQELRASEKDQAELAMIVDVVRNDLGRVSETGSVEVTAHAQLLTLPTVHHLYSSVRGRLRPDRSPIELLRAAFPAASITGAPKIEAMRIAQREEGQLRGPCMGAIGWIGLNGDMELSVAIRTAFVSQGVTRYYAGCGITADSNPQEEFRETRHKAMAFVRALGREHDPNW